MKNGALMNLGLKPIPRIRSRKAEPEGGEADVNANVQTAEPATTFKDVMAAVGGIDPGAEEQRDQAWSELRAIREAIGASPEEATLDEVEHLVSQFISRGRQLNEAGKTIASLSEQVQALHAQLDTRETAGYLIRAPKQPPRIVHGRQRAQFTAIAAARRTGRATVFALQPVGKAVRGAEWVEG